MLDGLTQKTRPYHVPRFVFGPPKTDKSRRTIDFPDFVRTLLIEERRRVVQSRALAGKNWEETAPEPRAVDGPENGHIVATPQVGGLHHRYGRRAA